MPGDADLAFPFTLGDVHGPLGILLPGYGVNINTIGEIGKRFVVGQQQVDVGAHRQEVLLPIPVGVGLERGAEVPVCPGINVWRQILHIPCVEPVGHLAVVCTDDVRSDVVGVLLNRRPVKYRVIVQNLEQDGHPVLILERLDDLVDEELLLARWAEQPGLEDEGLACH